MSKLVRWLWLLTGCLSASLLITVIISAVAQDDSMEVTDWVTVESGRAPLDKSNFQPMVAADRFPPITEFPVVSAEEAAGHIDPSELVIGLQIGSEARAYPINMLTGPSREILNDQLGDQAIAATW